MKNCWKKKELKLWFEKKLAHVLEDMEREEIFFRLLEHHGISRLDWATHDEVHIDTEVWTKYISELKRNKPIQYILGYEYFMGEKYHVSPDVLIPRPETEELVGWIVSEVEGNQPLNILEVGTGSGCIAVSLKKRIPLSLITATDISKEALAIAATNATELGAEINFQEDDILQSGLYLPKIDIIVSNPPYIPPEEAGDIASRVKDFEPAIALFTEEENPLQFYRAILQISLKKLKPKGRVYFEVHEDYATEVFNLAKELGFNPSLKADFYGKQRMIRIKKV